MILVLAGACATGWLSPVSIHLRLLLSILAGVGIPLIALGWLASAKPALRRPFFMLIFTAPVVLLTAEFVLAWLDYKQDLLRAPLRKSIDGQRQGMLVRDPVTGYRLLPSKRYRLWDGWVTIDRNGFRSTTDVPRTKPAGRRRLMLVGGSTVFGWGVGDDEHLGAYLQTALDTASGADTWEVINAGVPYFASFQELNWYLHVLHAFQPDLLVILHGRNDAIYAVMDGSAWQPVDAGNVGEIPFYLPDLTEPTTPFLESTLTRIALYRRLYAPFKEPSRTTLNEPGPSTAPAGPVDPRFIDQFARHSAILAREAAVAGTQTLFALQPVIHVARAPVGEEERFMDRVTFCRTAMRSVWPALRASAAAQREPRHLDLTEIFREVPEPVYLDHCHYTPTGNRLLAERLAKMILTESD